jgi:phage shock protein PspC (stress-responsive transcriptional regulator)
MEKHINVVAVLQIGLSIFGVIVAIAVYTILNVVGNFTDDQEANFILKIIANVIATFFIILSIPGIIGGIGLLKRKEWARVLVLILSVLHLFRFPVGTAVGIYSIWALVQPEIVAVFDKNPQSEPTIE